MNRYEDKEVQRDKKLVSYDIVDKQGKPYVKVNIGKEDKVRKGGGGLGGGVAELVWVEGLGGWLVRQGSD